ncbi:MAG TPA: SIMPL domain-containing protein [Clostridiales bacterium]|nr:MAG: hypothetical protein A2Y18_08030 [Clostridiales bacterium GWD2_32_19]HCC07861.1 SIMPL domain-containing protein [Clostridiales bacterium]
MNKGYIAIIISVIISLALVISTFTLSNAIKSVNKDTTIAVTGSAQEDIKSDYAVWTGSFQSRAILQKDAYTAIIANKQIVLDFIKSLDVKEDEIEFSAINTTPVYKRDYNGNYTNELEGYDLYQMITIKSPKVELVDNVSKQSTDLIAQGINFTSNTAQFYCKDLSEAKIRMVGKATADCKKRADQIVSNAGGRLGCILSSKTGVFQITPQNSTEISDYGINDTSSIDKQITAVVKSTFSVN